MSLDDTKHSRGARWRQSLWLPAIEFSLVIALAVGDRYGMVLLSRNPFMVILAWISLRLRGLRWRDVGFSWPRDWPRALLIGSLAGVAMELFSTCVTVPFLSRLAGRPPDLSDFQAIVGNLKLLVIVLVPMWLLAAFAEEMVYRGYLMSRIAGLGGGTRGAWIVSLLVISAFFGSAHEGQGLTGMVQEGFAGLLLGTLYLACGRTLTVPIVAHGVANTVAFVLIYLDRYPGV